MKKTVLVLSLLAVSMASFASTASAAPKHWYKDKRWWIGEAVIVAAEVLDVQSSCRAFSHGAFETNWMLYGTRSCGQVVGVGVAGLGFETALHALIWHCSESSFHPFHCYGMNNDTSTHKEAWQTLELMTVPAITAAGHVPAAIHNYSLPDVRFRGNDSTKTH